MINTLLSLLASSTANVVCPSDTSSAGTGAACNTGLPKVSATSTTVHNVLTIFFGVAAIISVLMIIIGALMFVTSGGNPQSAAKARETIMYAAIGLLVSLSAEAVVAFVLGKL